MDISSIVLEYLLLENFQALYNSTGMRLIEIDKTISTHPITLILGANGSGKSILISELNPSPNESTNNRSGWKIIENESGRKIVRFRVNDQYRYTCKIYYDATKKTTCYLERENLFTNEVEELNPNGNVRPYEEAVALHLGYKKENVSLGYLSEAIVSFIEKKPVERNNYISSLLPHVEEWINNFNNLTKKFNLIKRQVKMIDDDVAKIVLGDYELEINRLNFSLQEIDKIVDIKNSTIIQGETYLRVITEVDGPSLQNLLDVYKRNANALNGKKAALEIRMQKILEYAGDEGHRRLLSSITELEANIRQDEFQLAHYESETNVIQRQIEDVRGSISSSTGVHTLTDLSRAIEAIEAEITQLKQVQKDFLQLHGEWIQSVSELDEKDIAGVAFVTKELQQHYLNVTQIVDNREIREGLAITQQKLAHRASIEKDEFVRLEEEINTLSKKIYALNNRIINPDILKLRPDSCTPDRCEIVKALMELLKPSHGNAELDHALAQLQKTKVEVLDRINELGIRINAVEQANRIVLAMNDLLFRERELLGNLPEKLSSLFLVEDIVQLIQNLPMIVQDVETLQEGSALFKRLIKLEETRRSYISLKETILIQERVSSQYANLVNQYNSVDAKRIETYRRLDALRTSLNSFKLIQKDTETIRFDVAALNDEIARHSEDGNTIKSYATCFYQRKKILDRIYQEREAKERYLRDRAKIQNEIETLNTKKISKESLERTRDDLLRKLADYQVLLNVWSPRIGFPAKMIKEFLEEIKERTNQDMNELWGGSLLIEDFVISNNEFSITINRSGTPIKDASECSLSERSMLAVAISLSIMEIGMESKYDLIRLDEIDGPLDATRRTTFVETIMERLNRMGVKDCYIITHNNEFDNIEANVILLPGFNNLARLDNKTVIFTI